MNSRTKLHSYSTATHAVSVITSVTTAGFPEQLPAFITAHASTFAHFLISLTAVVNNRFLISFERFNFEGQRKLFFIIF